MGNVKRSPWLLHYDAASCNGCDIEVLACLTPTYDAERLGVINTGDPMQADIMLVTGGVNTKNADIVRQLYNQMPRPKVVVAVGVCACTGGIFKDCYNVLGGVDRVIPVDIYVPGCAARPEAIIDGIIKGVELFQKRADEHEEMVKKGMTPDEIGRALDAQRNWDGGIYGTASDRALDAASEAAKTGSAAAADVKKGGSNQA